MFSYLFKKLEQNLLNHQGIKDTKNGQNLGFKQIPKSNLFILLFRCSWCPWCLGGSNLENTRRNFRMI